MGESVPLRDVEGFDLPHRFVRLLPGKLHQAELLFQASQLFVIVRGAAAAVDFSFEGGQEFAPLLDQGGESFSRGRLFLFVAG